jgi:cytochrome b561
MNMADVERGITDLTPEARSEIAAKVAADFAQQTLSESERPVAENILRLLVKDGAVGVRETLSAHLKTCTDLPHDIALALATDVESVALPLLAHSEVLNNTDLMEIIAENSRAKQTTIAQRRDVAAPVADALIDSGNEAAAAKLIANEAADLSAKALARIMDDYGNNEAVTDAVLRRAQLPPSASDRSGTAIPMAEFAGGMFRPTEAASQDSRRFQQDQELAGSNSAGSDIPVPRSPNSKVSKPKSLRNRLSNLQKSDAPTFLLHWSLVLTLVFSLVTGLRIASDAEDSSWARAIAAVLPQGDVVPWHLWAALSLLSIATAYVVFLLRARLTQRIALSRQQLNGLVAANGRNRWRSINILLYWVAFACIFVAGITGLLLYLAPGLLPYLSVSAVHQAVAWSIIAYAVLHIATQTLMGGLRQLLKVLNPQRAYGAAAAIGLMAAAGTAAAFYGLEQSAVKTLEVARVGAVPVLDGLPNDAAWDRVSAVEIHTSRGANLPGGEVTVPVRALHDGEYFYGLFQWPDSTRSQKHLPLVKSEQGWKVMQTEFGIQDEDSYYEDKFGVMLSDGSGIAGDGSAHLGNQPLEGKPGPSGGRGLHYTTDGGIVDVWHWKSVRTGNFLMEQIDDNYFGPPMEPKGSGRYTGGYTKDPADSGGFKMNWEE